MLKHAEGMFKAFAMATVTASLAKPDGTTDGSARDISEGRITKTKM